MVIPPAALDEVGGRSWMREGVTLDATAPATRLLTSHLDTLSEVLPGLGSAAMGAARMAALELFVGALRSDSDVCSVEIVRPALRASIERYIDRDLLDGAVTPAALAAAHWVSIRTVNRVFSATGQTVGEVVRVRRLRPSRRDRERSAHHQHCSALGLFGHQSLQPHLQGPLRLFTDGLPHRQPLRRPGVLTHRAASTLGSSSE
jgi:AraC-like DNA-binding protein